MKEHDVDDTVAGHSIISLRLPSRLVDELDVRAAGELLTELAASRLQALAQRFRGSGIPEGVYLRQWEARGGHTLGAFPLRSRN
jgi:hypothetical protein